MRYRPREHGTAGDGRPGPHLQLVAEPDGAVPSRNQYAILGLLSMGLRSGYEIKRALAPVPRCLGVLPRCLSALAPRLVYSDLERLASRGLITPVDASHGHRRRTFYELTPTGEIVFRRWVNAGANGSEMQFRHAGLERLYFSDRLTRAQQIDLLRGIESHHRASAASDQQRSVYNVSSGPADIRGPSMTSAVKAFDTELDQFVADWCRRQVRAMSPM